MCGIMGYYAFGDKRPDKKSMTDMFSLLESRGRDASGFAYFNQGKLEIYKAPIPSSQIIKSANWISLELPQMMIFHTRLMTKGDPKNNMNNHPLFTKDGLCIVHNGMIHNDDEILDLKPRDGEVDSEAILSLLSSRKKSSVKHLFDDLFGTFAVAMIDEQNPQKLTLIRNNNPIDLYFNAEDDILYFCSERNIMQKALGISKLTKRGFNIGEGNYHFYEMADNHTLEVASNGILEYKEHHPRRYYPRGRLYPMDDYYWGLEEVECPFCLKITDFDEGVTVNYCRHCGSELTDDLFLFE